MRVLLVALVGLVGSFAGVVSSSPLLGVAPFLPNLASTAPQLAATSALATPTLVWNAQRTTAYALDQDDGVTLTSVEGAPGIDQNWSIDLSQFIPSATGAPVGPSPTSPMYPGFTCAQSIALSVDDSLLYAICNSRYLLALHSSTGAKAFMQDLVPSVFPNAPSTDLRVQLLTAAFDGGLVLATIGTATVQFNGNTGALVHTFPPSASASLVTTLFILSPQQAGETFFFSWLQNPTNSTDPATNTLTAFNFATKDGRVQGAQRLLTASTSYVQGMACVQPYRLNPQTPLVQPLLFVVEVQRGVQQVVEYNDNNALPYLTWPAAQSPDLVASILTNPFVGVPNTGVVFASFQDPVYGDMQFLVGSTLASNTLTGYDPATGLVVWGPTTLSFSVAFGTLSYSEFTQQLYLLTESKLVVLDFAVVAGGPDGIGAMVSSYAFVATKYYTQSQPMQLYAFDRDGAAQAQGTGYASGGLRIEYLHSLNATLITGADVSGHLFQSVFGTSFTRGCSSFASSCSSCQVDTIENSAYVCTWCASPPMANTSVGGTCQPMWATRCPHSTQLANTSSSECASALSNGTPAGKQPALIIILCTVGVFILGCLIVLVRRRQTASRQEDYQSAN